MIFVSLSKHNFLSCNTVLLFTLSAYQKEIIINWPKVNSVNSENNASTSIWQLIYSVSEKYIYFNRIKYLLQYKTKLLEQCL